MGVQMSVQQQAQEVDNAETAALVAVDEREEAVRKLSVAHRHLEDAKGKQQHSLQVTTNPAVSPDVSDHPMPFASLQVCLYSLSVTVISLLEVVISR